MALPVLKLNLAPPPTLWRQYHVLIAWTVLLAGALSLGGALLATALAYRQASIAGHTVADLTTRRQNAAKKQTAIQLQLEAIDVEKELPRWRLAERILAERGLPWSRLAVELERSMVQDVRIKSIQRTRNSSQKVELKIKGEARNRTAEDAFLESLHKNPFFAQVILERESESQSGGLEFECVLPAVSLPAPYESLPKFGPARASTQTSAPPPSVQQKPVPQRMTPPVNRSAPVAAPPPMVTRPTPMQPHPGTPPNSPTYRPNMPPIHRQFPNSAPPQGERQ